MGFGAVKTVFLCLIVVFAVGCADNSAHENQALVHNLNAGVFESQFGFSFDYPTHWTPNEEGLPNNWALVLNDINTILMLTFDQGNESLDRMGQIHAIEDLFTQDRKSLDAQQLTTVANLVKVEQFAEREWYTYAIKIADKGVNSIVSGTYCNGKEIMMVLVSAENIYELNKALYTQMLESFTCDEEA